MFFTVFAESEKQSSVFGTLDLENLFEIKSYMGSLSALTSVFWYADRVRGCIPSVRILL